MIEGQAAPPTPDRDSTGSGSVRAHSWRWTAITGISLLVLITIHMVAHHFVVEEIGGLRTYQHVLDYINTPVIFVIEAVFLVVVTVHAMLGLRSVLLDFGLSDRMRRLLERGLVVLGVATVVYGFVLIGVLASRA
ncbi:MAG: succinate dehydrogenase, hydrophobic membrane anchor protein [Actinomycetota bacterium]